MQILKKRYLITKWQNKIFSDNINDVNTLFSNEYSGNEAFHYLYSQSVYPIHIYYFISNMKIIVTSAMRRLDKE